ncbi:MAG: aminotransferase class I/II-fold pyridoxal phosphate-dependent enzyme [Candidatus Marinimicrobia bacterium]|nr:aminotransferase class I/II-fold pyridoxal phosphate-dependent enzyme [Candidatus Neomarinimicrobiota bacterium]MBL7046896.1 aminotransferase class I/II-fold pyridoxal phosphate-dependent enzyme [Candidatus Neomarinimicrobiota bacterium]
MKDIGNFSDETKVVHAGIEDNEHLAVVPPIYQTSTFKFRDAEHGANLFRGEEEGFIYTRMGNPTIKAFENAIAILENGYRALACASGMAAIHTVFTSLVSKGDHLICSKAVYGPTVTLLNNVMRRYGVEATFADTSGIDEVKKSFRDSTKIVYVETPGNPTLVISDIRAIADLAHEHGALMVVDNTFMSPILQKPLDMGADIVLHSLTKFLNGHADVVGGVVVVKDEETYKNFRKTLNQIGGVLSPFDAFLVHRGIKTLSIRMEKHCKNAQIIAEFLESHSKVEWVRYPGLKSHPQYEIAKKQMSEFGGMIVFELRGGVKAGETLMNNVHLLQLAVSLGGVESLIQHPASMTHSSMDKETRLQAGITDGLVRISVGIEKSDELIADLEQTLQLL